MMTNKYRGRSHDLHAIDDIDNASEASKAYADMRARAEINALVQRYANNLGFLRLLAMHLDGQSKAKFQKHIQEQADTDPQKKLRDQIKREVYAELGIEHD